MIKRNKNADNSLLLYIPFYSSYPKEEDIVPYCSPVRELISSYYNNITYYYDPELDEIYGYDGRTKNFVLIGNIVNQELRYVNKLPPPPEYEEDEEDMENTERVTRKGSIRMI
jgi:hypothetical protein